MDNENFNIKTVLILKTDKSLINNRMGTVGIHSEAFEVGFKEWDWSIGSIQDPWYAGFHPRAARTRAKRAYSRVYFRTRVFSL